MQLKAVRRRLSLLDIMSLIAIILIQGYIYHLLLRIYTNQINAVATVGTEIVRRDNGQYIVETNVQHTLLLML